MDPTLAGRILAIALAFGLMVFVHEAGHFVAARLAGMAVYEFSIGFGRPLLFWFRRGGTQYSFRLWPFFSYVRIAGMEPGDDHPDGFGTKSRPAQAVVLVTGCMMNFLLATGIYIVMGAVIGMPVAVNRVEEVARGMPAAKVGLMPGDRILGVNGRTDLEVVEIQKAIEAAPGRPLTLEIERAGERRSIRITPKTETLYDIKGIRLVKVPAGRIGIAFATRLERMGAGASVVAGFVQTYEMIRLQIAALIAILARTVPAEMMAGPVGVVHLLYSESKGDWLRFLSLSAMLTAGIGFLNLLPIPPLDGSRLFILALEALRRKPFDKRKELVVHLVGFVLLLALLAVLTYRDILRIVAGGSW